MLSKIETNPIVRSSTFCLQLIKESRLFHACALDKEQRTSSRFQPRPSTGENLSGTSAGAVKLNLVVLHRVAVCLQSYNPSHQLGFAEYQSTATPQGFSWILFFKLV